MKTLIFDAIVKRHYRISILRDEDTLYYHIYVEHLEKGKFHLVDSSMTLSHDRAFKDFYMYICVFNDVKINFYD